MQIKNTEKPPWVKIKEKELKEIIEKLSVKYKAPEIGLILRDQYGIPTTKIYGKKLAQYLKELGIDTNIELKNSETKIEKLKEHLKKNVTDKIAKHRFQKAQSRLNILKRYFNKSGKKIKKYIKTSTGKKKKKSKKHK